MWTMHCSQSGNATLKGTGQCKYKQEFKNKKVPIVNLLVSVHNQVTAASALRLLSHFTNTVGFLVIQLHHYYYYKVLKQFENLLEHITAYYKSSQLSTSFINTCQHTK